MKRSFMFLLMLLIAITLFSISTAPPGNSIMENRITWSEYHNLDLSATPAPVYLTSQHQTMQRCFCQDYNVLVSGIKQTCDCSECNKNVANIATMQTPELVNVYRHGTMVSANEFTTSEDKRVGSEVFYQCKYLQVATVYNNEYDNASQISYSRTTSLLSYPLQVNTSGPQAAGCNIGKFIHQSTGTKAYGDRYATALANLTSRIQNLTLIIT